MKVNDMRMLEGKRVYGLFTAVAAIVGTVIGSGIFFKSDNILVATGGNVALGVVVFCAAALAIVFGCLSMGSLAQLTDKPGGVISYFEEFIGAKVACAFGWFQAFVYYPTLTVVVSWVVGIYASALFNLNASLELQIGIGIAWFLVCFAFNLLSARAGGFFQRFSTVMKLLPLVLIGVLGFVLGDPVGAIAHPSPEAANAIRSLGWISAIGPVAFSFDGWVVATAIGYQVKDARRNVPKALVIAPLFILLAYVVYFVGVSAYVGPQQVIGLGDESVPFIATRMFSPWAAKALVVFVVVSVMGTVNGLVMGAVRIPYSLALKGMLPGAKRLSSLNPRFDMPVNSGVFSMCVCLLWWAVHYAATKFELLPNSDISEISVAVSYLLYLILYVQVFRYYRQGKITGALRGVACPLLAGLGSAFILFGGLQNPLFARFALICLGALALGYAYAHWKRTA